MVPESKIIESLAAVEERSRGAEPGVSALRCKLAVLRYGRIVFRVAHLLLNDRHEAEDVSQEAFLRYWQHGRGVERPKEWLLAVARNACVDRLRRSRPLLDLDERPEPGDDRDPLWHLQQAELGARLRAHIARLPEPQRSLVVLFDMQGIDGASCARILDLNVNQVKVYLHRARKRLRRDMEDAS